MNTFKRSWWPTLTALSLAVAASVAKADERESLEALRQTTLGLINALVDKGVLTREVADGMLKQAQARAVDATAANAPTASAKPVQRVPYVSEAMKTQIRNEVKEEVLTQARAERWGVPNATPSWVDRIKIDGDFRFRYQQDRFGRDNLPASSYVESVLSDDGLIRAPDLGAYSATGLATASTSEGRDRERLRLRLGLSAKVTDEVGVGVRLATGSDGDRVSTNQTLGQNFNKYPLLVDRAFVRVDPADWLSVQAGRLPNPWFSTDMIWSENLNFEGLAATTRWSKPESTFEPFATMGAFPLRENTPPTRDGRWLYGAQIGAAWSPALRTKLKFGLAYYSYKNIEGHADSDFTGATANTFAPGVTYGQYEYPKGLRQKGNTLFDTNADIDVGQPLWGLAYKFRPVTLTASAEFTHFSPYSLLLSAEFVKNTAFDLSDFQRRSERATNPGGRDSGYQMKMAFGAVDVREAGQWQASASYRHLGSDAVLDAFNDSDLGLGGTNVQGYTLAFNYGLYRNTTLGMRYLASRTIDTPLNDTVTTGSNPVDYGKAKFKVNTLQVDFNVRF